MHKINQFNRYLLEKHPTVWNTKIVWMLLASLIVHIIFFFIGYVSHADPASMQGTRVKDDYFKDGMIFIHLIISVLLIVAWLITMFRNNAFKSFYPLSRTRLFLQFVQYFVIILISVTFYFSYMSGFKMFVRNKYPDAQMAENVKIINRANAFLSQNLEYYTLENRIFPGFNELYCETDLDKIDRNKKYFVYYNRVYQYYSLYSKKVSRKDRYGNFVFPEGEKRNRLVDTQRYTDTCIYFFKKDVLDMSSYINTAGLTYFNFSEIFYDRENTIEKYISSYPDPVSNGEYTRNHLRQKRSEISRLTSGLLKKKDPAELEMLMKKFLDISGQFGIRNNLDAKSWAKMVYAPDDFKVRYFIKKYQTSSGKRYDPNDLPEDGTYDYTAPVDIDSAAAVVDGVVVNDSVQIRQFNPDIQSQLSPAQYFKNNTTGYYYYSQNLEDFLYNVDLMKSSDFFSENIHIYIWIAFFLASMVFSFRITGLKPLLFGLISAGILMLAVVLISLLFSASFGSSNLEFFISYFGLFIWLIILLGPVVIMKRLGKLVASILINISINGFVLFLLLVFFIIDLHQLKECNDVSMNSYNCRRIIEILGFDLSYIILAGGFLFLYLYTAVIRKWKALPE